MKIVKDNEEAPANKYDPSLRYTWTPQDTFEFNGEQFGAILNAFRNILNTPKAAKIVLAYKANEVIEDVMADAVNRGIVKEVTE